MADDIDQWLEELSGRARGDELTESLRRAVAKREGPQMIRDRGAKASVGDLALKRLHRRLADEGLLEPNPIHRLFRPSTPAWLPAMGLTASILLAFTLSVFQPGAFKPSEGQDRPMLSSAELAGESGFAAAASEPTRLLSPKSEARDYSAPLAEADASSGRSQKRASRVFTVCSRNPEGLLQVDIAVKNIVELRRHYARFAAIEAIGLRFDTRHNNARLLWSNNEAGERLAKVLKSKYGIRCTLNGERALALNFSPVSSPSKGSSR